MAESKINLNPNIQVIEGAFATSTGFSLVAYPIGFSNTNCVVISFDFKSSGSYYRLGQGTDSATFSRTFVELNPSGLNVFNSSSQYYGASFRLVVLKIA